MIIERWYEDASKWEAQPWIEFRRDSEGPLWAVRRCPECGRYIKAGTVHETFDRGMVFENWKCKTHGDVEPYWVWG